MKPGFFKRMFKVSLCMIILFSISAFNYPGTPPEYNLVEGSWTGTTSRGQPMSFTVSGTQWSTFKLKTDYSAPSCYVTSGTIEITVPGPGSITSNHFSYTSSTYSFTGDFTSSTTATGTYSFTNYSIYIYLPFPPYACYYYLTQSGTWSASIPLPAPGAFSKLSPVDDPVDQSTSLTLSWNPSSYANSYQYCLDADVVENATCDTSWVDVGGNTSVSPPGLTANTTYYWQVRASNATGTTIADGDVWWSFTTLNTHTLTVSKEGNGSGTVTSSPPGIDCGVDCSETYTYGTVISLTPTPAFGSVFMGWGGECSGTGSCIISMTTARAVTATFSLQTFGLTVNKDGTGDGTITSNIPGINCGVDCHEIYDYGTLVTLTANPALGSTFTGWNGAGCSGTGTCVVTVTDAFTVTATFTLQTYTLTVNKAGAGSGTVTSSVVGINCGADCDETYAYGTEVTLTPDPDAGSVFSGWSGEGCTGTGTCTVTMTAARSVTATFTNQTYTLTVSKTGTGDGYIMTYPAGIYCGEICSATFNYGTEVILFPGGSTGSTFTGWSGGGCEGISTCNLTMDADKSVTANYTINTYPLTVSKEGTGSGTITSSPPGIDCGTDCSEWYTYNTPVTLTALPTEGFVFTGWSVSGCPGTGTCTINVAGYMWVTAYFYIQPGAFVKNSSANGAVNQPLSLTLAWGSSDNALSYEYCYDTTDDNACSEWIYNGTSTHAISGLSEFTTYYWHVRALNGEAITYSDDSELAFWSFTTGEAGAFNKSSPADGAVNQISTPTLKWSNSQDAIFYQYCYDTTDDDACLTWKDNGTATSAPLTGLAPNTTYYWQVRAINAAGIVYADGSEAAFRSFKTARSLTFRSTGTQDGWVLESSENSNLGGILDSASTTLRLGDDAGKRQYRSILSFATGATLPDNAVIVRVTLKVKRQAVVGAINPILAFQGFMLDIRKGFFGTAALQTTDWSAAASRMVGPYSPPLAGGWYTFNITGAKAYINKLATGSGLTQIRLRFYRDDNNDTIANYLSLFSGNYATLTARPTLIVEYYVP